MTVLPLGVLVAVPPWCHSSRGGGSDLAERREVQCRQGMVEHISHCSQQLEAGKHLVKEVREGLLQGEGQ